MARGRKPRTWVKMDCEGILHGSVNYLLTLEGQAVWIKMIALSEVSGGKSGYIEDNNENGLPYEYIAHELHCTVETLETVLKIMEADKAIEINGTGSIHLVNFYHYQFSEYDRQKPSREAKKERDKSAYGEFQNVRLSDVEKAKLIEKFGEKGSLDRIERLSCGIESKGYKYESHYATILNWERMDGKEGDLRGRAKAKTSDNRPRKYQSTN